MNIDVKVPFEELKRIHTIAENSSNRKAFANFVGEKAIELAYECLNKNINGALQIKLFEPLVGKSSDTFTLGAGDEGGAVQRIEYWSELVTLLRDKSIMRQIIPTTLPVATGKLQVSKQTAGATAYWVDEATAITPSKPKLETQYLIPKKLAALTPVSNDVIRYAGTISQQIIQNSLAEAIAEKEDETLIMESTGTGKPKGLLGWATSSVDATGLSEVEVVKAALSELAQTKRVSKPVWILPTRAKIHLQFLQNSNGAYVFPEVAQNILAGAPIYTTTLIPYTSGKTTAFLVDASALVLGQGMTLTLEFFPNATYASGSSIISGVSTDESVFRAIEEIDFYVKYPEQVVKIINLTWGAS